MNESRLGRLRIRTGRARKTGALLAVGAAALATTAALLMPAVATAATTTHLDGHLDVVSTSTGVISVQGWAIDLDHPNTSARVYAYVGGTASPDNTLFRMQTLAHNLRTDVARAHPGYGENRGFTDVVSINPGTFPLCLSISAYAGGAETVLGCTTVTVAPDRRPIGHLESIKAVGGNKVQVTGWTADPNVPTVSNRVNVYLGGVSGRAYKSVSAVANVPRADIANALGGYGAYHGFSLTVSAESIHDVVCVYGINDRPGFPATLFPCVHLG